ncbi:hypothetical protein TNCV_2330061 [Trichonephila clavipes]|nr:hypothetical protein TNCV_2330061 [Trichonephila clavipes]
MSQTWVAAKRMQGYTYTTRMPQRRKYLVFFKHVYPESLCGLSKLVVKVSDSWQEFLQCGKKSSTRLVSGPHSMVDTLKLPNQAPRGPGESLQKCVAWRCPDGTRHLICSSILAILGQSLSSTCPVVDSRDLNLVFGHVEATPNK